MALSFKDHKLSEAEMTWLKAIYQDSEFDPNRADEIEHQDRITDLILSEIERCAMVIANLSYKRPNVYYEIGYAHALKRRPILYRKTGTKLHFDLSVHNVPEYKNLTELRSLLLKRLEAVLGQSPASG
jgi:nucleoside 2-deoxyribosyltransferase